MAGFLLGIAVTLFFQANFEPKLTLGEILNALTTIILAYVVSVFWRNQQHREDCASELIVNRVEAIQEMLQVLRADGLIFFTKTWNEEEWQQLILGPLRQIANLMDECKDFSEIFFENDKLTSAKKAYFHLKQELTKHSPSSPLEIQDIPNIETSFTALRKSLIQVIGETFKR